MLALADSSPDRERTSEADLPLASDPEKRKAPALGLSEMERPGLLVVLLVVLTGSASKENAPSRNATSTAW